MSIMIDCQICGFVSAVDSETSPCPICKREKYREVVVSEAPSSPGDFIVLRPGESVAFDTGLPGYKITFKVENGECWSEVQTISAEEFYRDPRAD